MIMINYTELAGLIPMQSIIEALDDNGDGAADAGAWNEVLAAANERIGDCFGGSVPEAYAGSVGYARKIFCAEILFSRRGLSGDHNPFGKRAIDHEQRLRRLASGDDNASGASGVALWAGQPRSAAQQGLMV